MKRPTNRGSVFIETMIGIPLCLIILFGSLELSLLTISKRLVQWACYTGGRNLLVSSMLNHQQLDDILKLVPLSKGKKEISIQNQGEIHTFHLTLPVSLFGKEIKLHETISFHE